MRRADLPVLIVPAAWAGVLGILALFLWSGLEGGKGLAALAAAEAEEARLAGMLAELSAERAAAENRVRRLSADYLDLDLLDERARDVLGLARPDEIVIPPISR